jgi:uncharacterized protein YcaQ
MRARTQAVVRPLVSANTARRLLLDAQGLTADPARRATPRSVQSAIEQLGFVQVDTINVVERAHDHILHTRFDGYRGMHLARLLERDRSLFEHWTHDASVIRADWFPYWRRRFDAFSSNGRLDSWLAKRIGQDADATLRHVWRRITREGPLMSRDFDDGASNEPGGWWNWKPSRAALEILWRIGRLSIHGRRNFQKVYDRTDRVFPELSRVRKPSARAHLDWACRSALERLGVAVPSEIAHFFDAVKVTDARVWAERAVRAGEVVPVRVESADGTGPRDAIAVPDWERRANEVADPPDRIRLLNPFDPVIRDRARTQRRFGFDYTIECFVPVKKRRYGYYVLPILEGDRFVGRLDAKFERDRGVLVVKEIWWESGVRETAARRRALDGGLDRFALQIGAEDFER